MILIVVVEIKDIKRNASMNGIRKNWKTKQRSTTPWNMSTCLHDWLLDKSYDEGKKEKKTRSNTWEANKTDIHFLCSRSGGFFYIRFEKAEARKEIGARIKKKKKKKKEARGSRIEVNTGWNSHETRAGWRTEDSRDFTPRPWSAISRQLHPPGNETSKARAHRTNFLHNVKTGTEATVVFDVCLRDYDLLDKKTIAFSSTLSSSPLLFLPPLNAESKNETMRQESR